MDLSARDLLVRQRTQLVNSVQGHVAGFGIIAAKGIIRIQPLLKRAAEIDIPDAAKIVLAQLGRCIAALNAQLDMVDARLAERHKGHPVSQRLAAVPGVGPTIALTLATRIDPS